MRQVESLSHTLWECTYHVVYKPKHRRKVLFGHIRRELVSVLRRLAEQKQNRIEEGHLMPDHVHMMNQSCCCRLNIGHAHVVPNQIWFSLLFGRSGQISSGANNHHYYR